MTDRDALRDRLDEVEATTGDETNLEPFRIVFRDPQTGEVSTEIDIFDGSDTVGVAE